MDKSRKDGTRKRFESEIVAKPYSLFPDVKDIPRRTASERERYEFSDTRMEAQMRDDETWWPNFQRSMRERAARREKVRTMIEESESAEESKPTSGLTFYTADELNALEEPYDFVRHVLYDNQLVVVYGEPGVAKSFFVLDLCARTGLGLPWFGRETDVRPALYIALEGTGGLKRRLHAWKVFNRKPNPPLTFATGLLSLGGDAKGQRAIIRHVRETGARIVVVDTVARAMPGASENDPKDMGALIAGADRIRRSTGATVILIAHSGKNPALGVRGHSSLKGAADVEIELTRKGEQRLGKVTKSKDGVEGVEFPFVLQSIETGLKDARGEPIQSAAVVESESFDDLDAGLTEREKQALDALTSITHAQAELIGLPTKAAWREAVKEAWSDMDSAKFRMAWKRAHEGLANRGLAVEGEHFV
ncbi:AAA family ATPase [Hyphomonas sp. ND6WE1B]|uniref:AAA family ATPase n=1 Tax=Hyphomonas sp. ND6WE1B TaxID=1848191 RepID=UPI000807689B|nr:AAA family ATPase [Hyphomonas sp. ND6WE1B]